MPYDTFFIGPPDKGLQTNVKPWIIMDNAFSTMKNAYTWRGRIKKRPGARVMNETVPLNEQQQLTRLRIKIGTTDAFGNFAVAAVPGIIWKVGQMFSCGTVYYTVYINIAGPQLTYSTGAGAATFDIATGAFTLIVGAPLTDVYYYPAEPVMGLVTYNKPVVSDEDLIAFDTQFAYQFVFATGWDRLAAGASLWSGANFDFFWAENYRGATPQALLLFVTNNVVADAMRYWNGAAWTAFGTAGTTAINAGGDFIETCKAIKQFKNRLLLFNVSENIAAVSTRIINRIRFSAVGNPLTGTAWRQDIAGQGGFIDIPVQEAITSVQDIKDQLIIFCESSTWQLLWTNNPQEPFIIQQINTELGVESLNSIIPFDKYVIGFGNNGIHTCNGINVERMDELIPNEVFQVSNANNGVERVAGIRDYYQEVVYWSYQAFDNETGQNKIFPNKVLLYNYRNDTWAELDDSITAYGNYQFTQDLTWADVSTPWEQMQGVWADASTKDRFKSVIAGNQEGFTFIVDASRSTNSICLQITNITVAGVVATITAYNHNLAQDSFVYFSNIVQSIGGNIGTVLNDKIFKVRTIDDNTFTINTVTIPFVGTYRGGGNVTRVSKILVLTKQFNFYNTPGMEIAVEHVDFLVDNSKDLDINNNNFIPAQITAEPLLSSATLAANEQALALNSAASSGIVECSPLLAQPYEIFQTQFWRRMYYNMTGESFAIAFRWSDAQMTNTEISLNDFVLNAMIFYVRPTKRFG